MEIRAIRLLFGFAVSCALASPAMAQEGHPLKGTWLGVWGPQKTPVFVVLDWNGLDITGTINPGPDAAPIKKASLTPPAGGRGGVRGATAPGSIDWFVQLEADGKAATLSAMPTIRRGDAGELVRQVQNRVGAVPDGVFGPQTEALVRQFQESHGLVADGIVGPVTWKAGDVSGTAGAGESHYVIDGKIENIGLANRTISGTWTQGAQKGDLRMVRQ